MTMSEAAEAVSVLFLISHRSIVPPGRLVRRRDVHDGG
jgi:hypothetical protein